MSRALILVVVALGINWFGDSLDGTLARVRNRQRPRYGYYVDHVIDIVGALFLIGGLAASGYMTPLVGLGLLVGYMMVSAEIFLATYSLGVFRISFGPIGGTELRILLSIGTLYLLYKPVVQLGSLGTFHLFDVAGVCGIVGLAVALTVLGYSQYTNFISSRAAVMKMNFPTPSCGVLIWQGPFCRVLRRWATFNVVGVMGVGVQIITLVMLHDWSQMDYLPATALAVEADDSAQLCVARTMDLGATGRQVRALEGWLGCSDST